MRGLYRTTFGRDRSGGCLFEIKAGQVGPPLRVHPPGAEDAPRRTGRRTWRPVHAPAKLGYHSIGLGVVAAAAAGNDVLPDVLPAAAARDDMVDAGRGRGAVDATPSIPGEDSAAGERN